MFLFIQVTNLRLLFASCSERYLDVAITCFCVKLYFSVRCKEIHQKHFCEILYYASEKELQMF